MIDKDESEDGQLRVLRGDFSIIGTKGRAESLQCGRCVQFRNLPGDLLRNELSFEVWISSVSEPCSPKSAHTVLLLSTQERARSSCR